MTRKDFVLIAATIANARHGGVAIETRDALDRLSRSFSDALKRAFPNFDPARFLAACGVLDRISATDVSVTVGHETIECTAFVEVSDTTEQRVRFRYSGYTKKEAIAAFVAGVNSGEIR